MYCNKTYSARKQNPFSDWYTIISLISFKQTKEISQRESQWVKPDKTRENCMESIIISKERYRHSAEVKSQTLASRTGGETPSLPYGT